MAASGKRRASRARPRAKREAPRVAVVGAGIAGLTAALRLSQRGYQVTLYEARDYLGGKLGAHRGEQFCFAHFAGSAGNMSEHVRRQAEEMIAMLDAGTLETKSPLAGLFSANGRALVPPVSVEIVEPGREWLVIDKGGKRRHLVRRPCTCPAGGTRHPTLRVYDANAYHEHCYHMYLNWYHNFWRLVGDAAEGLGIDVRRHFAPSPTLCLLAAGEFPRFRKLTNSGAMRSSIDNVLSGVEPIPDMFLWSYALIDLLSQTFRRADRLSRYSVTGFLHSRAYATDRSAELYDDTIAKAFAARAELSSASSYQSFLKYGFRHPEPQMWLLDGNTYERLFSVFEKKLREHGCNVRMLRRVDRVLLRRAYDGSHRVRAIVSACPETVPSDGGAFPAFRDVRGRETQEVDAVVLAVPPAVLSRLILDPEGQFAPHRPGEMLVRALDQMFAPAETSDASIAEVIPELTGVRELRTEAMASLDLYLRKRIPEIPKGVVVLRDARFDLTFVDQSQAWRQDPEQAQEATILNVVATDYRAIPSTDDTIEGFAILQELNRFLPDFRPGKRWGDPDSDVDWDRTFVRVDAEGALFVNLAGSETHRPQTTYPAIPNLFLAGEFCDTPIDVATIEGAAVSGLLAARALQEHAPRGKPIEILQPEAYSQVSMLALKTLLAPYAFAAKAWSMANEAMAPRKDADAVQRLAREALGLFWSPYGIAADWWRAAEGVRNARPASRKAGSPPGG